MHEKNKVQKNVEQSSTSS